MRDFVGGTLQGYSAGFSESGLVRDTLQDSLQGSFLAAGFSV